MLLFGFSLLLWNCEQEELNVSDPQKADYVLEEISYKELLEDHDIQPSLGLLKKKLFKKRAKVEEASKSTKLAEGFVILVNKIKRIKTKEVTTWTFALENRVIESSDFENFLVKKYKDEFSYYLVSYEKTENNDFELYEKVTSYPIPEEYLNIKELDFLSKDSLDWAPTEDGSGTGEEPCEGVWTKEYAQCDKGGTANGHEPELQRDGSYCTGSPFIGYIIDFSHCESGTYEAPEGPSNDLSGGDSNDGSGGTADDGSSGDSTLTSPVGITDSESPCDPAPEGDINGDCMLQYYKVCLADIDIRGLTTAQIKELETFINTNSCSEQTKEFVKLAVSAIRNSDEVDFEDRIIYSNNPCVNNIIKLLQEKDLSNSTIPDLKGKSHLSQIILDLFNHSKKYDLTFKIDQLNSLGSGVNGNTDRFDITLDTDMVKDATQLFIAKTLIHESLHAFIHYSVRVNPGSTLVSSLNLYFQIYGTNSNLTEHQFMGQYVEALAYSLSSYDNHRQSMEYYKALSWGGLESSNTYMKLSSSDKIKIQTIITNERFTKKEAKSTKCP